MAKPRLLIHIGTHKTGTTTLQTMLAQSEVLLDEQGAIYPLTPTGEFAHASKQFGIYRSIVTDADALRRYWDRLERAAGDHGQKTMIVSDEHLSSPAVAQPARIAMLGFLKDRYDVEILCYLRRPDYFLESLWNQRCKNFSCEEHITDFVARKPNIKHADYLPMLKAWSALGKVTAIGFETAKAEGLVQNFNRVTGLNLIEQVSRNVSPSMECAAMLAALAREGMTVRGWRELNELIGPPERPRALGSRLRGEILARYADNTAELAAHWCVRFDERDVIEPEDPMPMPTPEAIENALMRLTRAAPVRRGAKAAGKGPGKGKGPRKGAGKGPRVKPQA
jgi:hypothetical protein